MSSMKLNTYPLSCKILSSQNSVHTDSNSITYLLIEPAASIYQMCRPWRLESSCYWIIFFNINSIFTFYSKIISALSHPFILSTLKLIPLTEFILLYYIININFFVTDNLNSQRLYTKFSPSYLTQGLLICVISNYLNSTIIVWTVMQLPTTAYKYISYRFLFLNDVIWTDDFKIWGLKSANSHEETIIKPIWTMYCNTISSELFLKIILPSQEMFSWQWNIHISGKKPYFTPTLEPALDRGCHRS